MPLPRMNAETDSLRKLLGLEADPGEVPSGIGFNESIRPSIEMQREAGILSDMNNRAESGLHDDLVHANAVRSAREDHGFTGSYPLEQQEQAGLEDKLRLITEPEKLKLEAAQKSAEEARTYSALEHEKDRQLREDIAQGTQRGLSQRSNNTLSQQDSHFQQVHPQGVLSKFFGIKPSTPAPSPGSMEEPTVKIQDPQSGEVRDIPQSRAQAVIARGGIQVQ